MDGTSSADRNSAGQFAAGNSLNQLRRRRSGGNPMYGRMRQAQQLLLTLVEEKDEQGVTQLERIIRKLFELAEGGNREAIREVLLRTLGRPTPASDVQQVPEAGDQMISFVFTGPATIGGKLPEVRRVENEAGRKM